ncbi:hypothetical protein [Rhodoplanes sp. Z2-YC6860]|uniref:hypothetical protein n=1 Tax=Rhodoplanes sp. Z2-YC6860 TaxID=674703 RepID=UPI00078DFDE3|nr:hypothetical protein [Rhodoplanes sp. Z2-YC6860]AMN40732.1 hypothetical protein RHPLAN_22920 [Rhodoplanes sp. Z2-YC6860]
MSTITAANQPAYLGATTNAYATDPSTPTLGQALDGTAADSPAAPSASTNVTLSNEAKAYLASASAETADLPPATLAAKARAWFDQHYDALGISSARLNGQTAVDLTGQSRTTLAAVAANVGGLFSADESAAAAGELQHRFNDAMKPYVVIARHTGDYASLYKAASDYMDQAGAVERATATWQQQRQALLEGATAARASFGKAPDTGNKSDPVRALLDSSASTNSTPANDVAAQARALLDDQINHAKDNGKELVFDPKRKTGQQADLSPFNNRMLATVALNQDGTFSTDEVRAAKTELDQRRRSSLLSALNSSNGSNVSAGSLSMIKQYASMSAEERSVLGVTDDVMNRLVRNYRSLTSLQNSLSGGLSMSSYF